MGFYKQLTETLINVGGRARYYTGHAKANRRVGDTIGVGQNPHFATLRGDQRFEALVR